LGFSSAGTDLAAGFEIEFVHHLKRGPYLLARKPAAAKRGDVLFSRKKSQQAGIHRQRKRIR